MDNENLNEINYSELTSRLIESPDKADEVLSTISDTEVLEDLYDAMFSEFKEYDKSYNIEHNNIITQIHRKISARIEELEAKNSLKELKEENSALKAENAELSEELSKEENINEIGE